MRSRCSPVSRKNSESQTERWPAKASLRLSLTVWLSQTVGF